MRGAIVAVSVLALAGTLAVLPASGRTSPAKVEFRVSGSLAGLYPGARQHMRVRVRNPYRRPLRVVAISAEARRASKNCTAANLAVRPFRGRLPIPPLTTRTIRLRVVLKRTAALGCAGGRFPLRFRAKGVVR